jgi:hypothetical protein
MEGLEAKLRIGWQTVNNTMQALFQRVERCQREQLIYPLSFPPESVFSDCAHRELSIYGGGLVCKIFGYMPTAHSGGISDAASHPVGG